MNIFLTGATGYIGSAVLSALVTAGHSVTALVRDETKADKVRRDGVTPVVGDLQDHDVIRRLTATADAVITTASPGDASSSAVETGFAEAVLEAALGDGKTFIRTGGVWVYGAGADITEEKPLDAPALVAWRESLDTRVLTAPGIRAVLVEPGIVYGHGGGIPNIVLSSAQAGDPPALRLVGPGTQHWTTVHVDDLAELYVAALSHGSHGSRFLGVSGDNPTTRELGEAASHRRGLSGRVAPEEGSETVGRLGGFGEALLLDQQASGAKARTVLGWKPSRPSLLEEIAAGNYDQA